MGVQLPTPTQHFCPGVVKHLVTIPIQKIVCSGGKEIDVVAEVIQERGKPNSQAGMMIMNPGIPLIGNLRIEPRISHLITEMMIVYPIGSQFFGDRETKASSDIGTDTPGIRLVAVAKGPGKLTEIPVELLRPFDPHPLGIRSHQEQAREPVVIRPGIQMGIIEAHSELEQVFLPCFPPGISPGAGSMTGKRRDQKASAVNAVVLPLGAEPCSQLQPLCHFGLVTDLTAPGILPETSFQRCRKRHIPGKNIWHKSVTHIVTVFIPEIMLPGHNQLQLIISVLPDMLADELCMAYLLGGHLNIPVRMIVQGLVHPSWLESVRIREEACFMVYATQKKRMAGLFPDQACGKVHIPLSS